MTNKQNDVKPISECQTLGEILVTLNHLVKELNEIPGVKATMSMEDNNDEQ